MRTSQPIAEEKWLTDLLGYAMHVFKYISMLQIGIYKRRTETTECKMEHTLIQSELEI